MKTTIHAYWLDVLDPEQGKAYAELCARMQAQGTKCFESWGHESHYNPKHDGVVVELETAFIFDDQWNTAPIEGISDKGLRVFDWAQDYKEENAKHIKQGHYLDLTPEMIEVRANRLKCGHCGKQYDKREHPPAFCHACLGSEYLKPSEVYLTRLEPATAQKFTPLTPEESAELMPIYRAEQAGKGSERSRKAWHDYGVRLQHNYNEKLEKISTEYNGKKWLYDRGCPLRLLKNCIYYDHVNQFAFGWSSALEAGEDLDWLLSNLSEFPYEYKIETVHRGTLGGRE